MRDSKCLITMVLLMLGAVGWAMPPGPSITTHPVSQDVCLGDTVMLTVAATGTDPLAYQWYLNGAMLAGEITDTLNIPEITPPEEGTYRCDVSDITGTSISNNAVITLQPVMPYPDAGGIYNICGLSVTLAGNTPAMGVTATWIITDAPMGSNPTFSDPNDPNATFSTDLEGYYALDYQFTQGACMLADYADIEFWNPTEPANAGPDQALCSVNSTTLAANTPAVGDGGWNILSGTGGGFSDPNDPNATFTGTLGETYTLEWVITGPFIRAVQAQVPPSRSGGKRGITNPCPDTMDTVTITFSNPPSTADAGLDIVVCSNSATLAATPPTNGMGTWTQLSGPGTAVFSDPNSPTATADISTSYGVYVFQWSVATPGCTPSTDTVTVTYDQDPTPADAGMDQSVCGLTATFAANTPTVGAGAWSFISGPGTPSIATPSSPSSSVSASAYGAYVFRWTTSNGSCTPSTNDVTITFDENPSTANAGSDQSVCGASTTLTGNTPSVGTGLWSVVSGAGGSFSSASYEFSTFTGTRGVTYTLRWTISNGSCPDSFDDVVITLVDDTTTAIPGPDQNVCGASTTLAANTPTVGTGSWVILSGTGGLLSSASDPNATFSGSLGETYVLGWQINNPPCAGSADTVSITFNPSPTTANAGADQAVCGTSTTLAGNTPTTGSGLWTVLSGTGGSFSNASDPTTTFSGSAETSYTLRWTISNAPCPDSTDEVNIDFKSNPTTANAGADQNICATTTTLAANTPTIGTGAWAILSGTGGSLSSSSDPAATFSGNAGETYVLSWTISNPPCTDSVDSLSITFTENPTTANAGADQDLCNTTTILDGNVPTVGTGLWTILSGTGGSLGSPTSNASTFTGIAGETYVLQWTISNAPCTDSSDTVSVSFSDNPTTANAGADQNVCATSTTLGGNTPTVGTGTWTIINGNGGSLASTSDPTTTFSGSAGTTYTLRWTIANSPCTDSFDEVDITFTADPTTANAGTDQNVCAASTTLAANTPTVGTGAWTIVSGSGGSFASAGDPTTTFSGSTGTSYVLRWTISNSPCTDSFDEVTITFTADPTTANAGVDQDVCGTSTTLMGNTAFSGVGAWSVISGGGGSFASTSNPASTFSGIAGTTYTLRWTISSGPCTDSIDEVDITFYDNPTTAAAGADQNVCATTTTLAANTPTTGSGVWSIISGAGGSFASTSDPTTTFSGSAGVTYTLRWTISNGTCTDTLDEVDITFTGNPTTAAAGSDQNVCAASTTLAANTPTTGSGAWSIISGSGGSFASTSDPTTTFSGLTGTTYTLRWTISNSPCTDSFDEVDITFTGNPTTAAAGSDQNVCAATTTLAANTPTTGIGTWSVVSGAGGSFASTSDPTTTFSGTAGATYTLRWTISNSPCVDSIDEVTITFTQDPTIAAAGTDQNLCDTSATLAANTPTIGTGAWTIVSGTGGSFLSATDPTTLFSGDAGATYVLRWTISNSPCTASTDDVQITFTAPPATAIAGPDQTLCADSATLAANTPTRVSGTWSVVSGDGNGVFSSTSDASATFSGTRGVAYTLRWSLSNPPCMDSTDDVVITFTEVPTTANAGTDINVCAGPATLAANTPTVGHGSWSVVTGDGNGAFGAATSPTSTFSGTPGFTYTLRWTISNNPCPDSSDDVNVLISANVTVAQAGGDQSICGAGATLAANTPTVGTGAWTIISGDGNGMITAPSSPTSAFSGTRGQSYTLRWTISNTPCPDSSDDVVITFVEDPTTANAGPDQTLCATTATLAANTPTAGVGAWSIVSGTGGAFANSANPTTTFSGSAGATYTLRWTISNAPCFAVQDDVVITFTQNPTTANAGADQTLCAASATLTANTPTAGTGAWSELTGDGNGVFANAGDPATTFSGTRGVAYTLRWTISNAPCTDSTDDVVITLTAEPTVANAGVDQTLCADTATLAANTATVGTGAWSVVSGTGGVFADAASPTTTFSGTRGSTYTLRWTISNAPCTDSTDDVVITLTAEPTVANAGADQTLCADTATLAANAPTAGAGAWSVVSGTGGSFADTASPTTTFSGTRGSTYTLRWTISNAPCADSSDDVSITLTQEPTVANAGTDQTLCADSAALAANAPTVGTGSWSVVSGSGGTFADAASPTTTFSGTRGITYTLRWTVANAPCTDSTDDVNITLTEEPTVANAGVDQTLCADSATLAANAPTVGTGSWSIVSGSGGAFADAAGPTTTFTGTRGVTYTLRWTISNAPCSDSSDDVSITLTQEPTVANAGADQTLCADTATLAANAPTVGTGSWSIISGTGGVFADAAGPTTSFSGTRGATYTLRWTISNAPCADSSDDVIITLTQEPTVANAGTDQTLCADTATLAANAPTVGTGSWSIISGTGGVFADAASPTTTFSGTRGATYTLRWTIANAPCSDSSDDVIITLTQEPTVANAGTDQSLCGDTTTLAANAPTIGTGTWTIISGDGNGVLSDTTNPTATLTGTRGVAYTLRWTLVNAPCTDSTDDVIITFFEEVTPPVAGDDQTHCGDTVTLAANAPTVGSGTWTILSGTNGAVGDPGSPTATFTGERGQTYQLQWTIANPPCDPASDTVTINLVQEPTVSQAGPDQEVCADNVVLAANTPDVGVGTWSIQSGEGGVLTDASVPTTTFTGTPGATYILAWTISNAPCEDAVDTVQIILIPEPTPADAGPDQTLLDGQSAILAANAPEIGTGAWSIDAGPSMDPTQFVDATSPTTTFNPNGGVGEYVLTWTTTNEGCPQSSDSMTLTIDPLTEIAWINTAGGAWSNPANWDPAVTPTADTNVTIGIAGSYTVQLDVAAQITSLTLSGSGVTFQHQNNLSVAAGMTVGSGVTVDLAAAVNPVAAVDGLGLNRLTNNGTINVSNIATINLDVVNNGDVFIKALGGTNAQLIGADFTNNSVLTLTAEGAAAESRITLSGTLINEVGATVDSLPGSGGTRVLECDVINRGVFNFQTPTTFESGAPLTDAETKTLDGFSFTNAGRINITAGGGLTFNGGSLLNQPTGAIAGNGTLDVSGAVFENQGAIEGDGIEIVGDAPMNENSVINITLQADGTVTGQLDVTGATTLAGTLNVALGEGFIPVIGNSYTLINYASATGAFNQVNLAELPIGLGFEVNQGATSFTLTIIKTLSDISFSGTAYTVNEDAGAATVTLTRSEPLEQAATVQFTTSDGTAAAGRDYTAVNTTVTFPAGTAAVTVEVPILNDTIVEVATETLTLTLSSPEGGLLIDPTSATLTIVENDIPARVHFSQSNRSLNEGDAAITLTLVRDDHLELPLSLTATTSPGTAAANIDYVSATQVIQFAAGQATAGLTVFVIEDTEQESSETFQVTLTSNDSNAEVVSPATSVITIVDNDNYTASFSTAAQTVAESAGSARVQLNLSAATNRAVTFNYTVSGTAGSGDHGLTSGAVTVPSGATSATLNVPITNDTLDELDETIIITLASSPFVGSPATHTITITDDDTAVATFSSAATRVAEGNAGSTTPVSATVQLNIAADRALQVGYTVSGIATAGVDHNLTSGTLTFPAGATSAAVNFDIFGDDTVETNETIIITLIAGDAALGSPASHVLTIEDDDELIVSWTSARQTILEGNITKRAAVTVTAQLNRPAPRVVSVPYTVGGAATFGVDHNLAPGVVQFGVGTTTATVTFDVIEDNTEEADEAVILILIESSVQLGAITRHVVTIDDDDQNQSPETAITQPANGATLKTGEVITATAVGTDPQGDALEYFWEICTTTGNCTFQTGQTLSEVSFTAPGVYIFTCYTVDAFGNEDNSPARATVTVVDNIPPTATITAPAADQTITAGETLTFQGVATDPDSETTSEYYFSDDPTTTFPGETFTFTFSEAGVFNLIFRVTDAEGATDTDWRTITVEEELREPVVATITAPADQSPFELTDPINFTGTVTGPDASTYKAFWNLGDGRTLEGLELANVTYSDVGRRTVTFFAVNGAGDRVQDQVTLFIQSNAQPVVDFEFPTDQEIQPGQDLFLRAVTVDAVGFETLDYFWSISDGRSFREATPGRIPFQTEGVYAISLHATSPAGIQSEVVSRTLTVRTATDERFEPNEDFTQAKAITPGRYENLLVTAESPDDFYRVEITGQGQRLLLRINLDGVALVEIYNESQVRISTRTISATGNVQLQGLQPGVYYVRIAPAPEAKRMGFSYGIALSVLNPALFFPDIQVNESFDTQLGIVNATNSTASLEALGYDRSGNIIGRVQLELPPLGRCHEPVTRLFGDQAERIAWVQVDSTNDLLGYARSESRDLKEMYATTAVKRLSSELYAPHIAQATNTWKTRAAVVNGSDLSSTSRLETPGESVDLELDGGFKQDNFDFVDRFGGQLPAGVEWASFKDQDANFSLAGVEVFGTVDGSRVSAGLELADIRQDNPNFTFVGNNLYFTHVARDVANFYTGIALVNISSSAQTVRITGFNPEGVATQPKLLAMGAGERVVQIAQDFLQGVGDVADIDWFLVEADNDIVGFELFGTHDGKRLAGLEAGTALRTELCYPFIDTAGDVIHGFSIVNVNSTGVTLEFTLYDNNGESLAMVTRTLKPTQKFIFTIDQLFSGVTLPEGRIPGWLGVRTDLPIAGFELFLNTTEQMGAIIAQ